MGPDGTYYEKPKPVAIGNHNPRIDELIRVTEESEGKMIVWARFSPEIKGITKRLRKEYGDDSVVELHGGVAPKRRAMNIEAFQDPDSSVRFFVGNQDTGGLGITLTEASTVVYYSNDFSLEKRLQSEDRAHRVGLRHPVTYVDLVVKKTIDEHIINALREKKNIADTITGDDWREWL